MRCIDAVVEPGVAGLALPVSQDGRWLAPSRGRGAGPGLGHV